MLAQLIANHKTDKHAAVNEASRQAHEEFIAEIDSAQTKLQALPKLAAVEKDRAKLRESYARNAKSAETALGALKVFEAKEAVEASQPAMFEYQALRGRMEERAKRYEAK